MSDTYKVTLLYDAVEDEETDPDVDDPVYQQVAEALTKRGHAVKTLPAGANVKGLVSQVEKDDSDVIFNLCESLGGIDKHAISVASLLELLEKPFTGAGPIGLTLAQDKALTKKLLHFHGIKYPKFSTMDAGQVEWSDELEFPLFVKPLNQDASIGIDENAIVNDVKALMERISYIHTEIHAPALIEEYIEGREIYIGVLGNEKMEALPILEWDFSKVKDGPKFATSRAKWDKKSEAYKAPQLFPEDLPEEVYDQIQKAAETACRTLKIWDYGRVDMRLKHSDEKGWEFYIIEVNPNPYLELGAEVALAAKKHGLDYGQLAERIVELAIKRKR